MLALVITARPGAPDPRGVTPHRPDRVETRAVKRRAQAERLLMPPPRVARQALYNSLLELNFMHSGQLFFSAPLGLIQRSDRA